MRHSIAFVIVAILCGCATKYQSQGFTGGFTETQLDKNVFRVSFQGNGFTRGERTEDMVLLRSAELAIKNNFTHFVIVDGSTKQDYSTFTTPVQSTTTANVNVYGNTAYGRARTTTTGGDTMVIVKPSSTNTVVFFSSRPDVPGLVYDASFICGSLGRKYEVTCGAN